MLRAVASAQRILEGPKMARQLEQVLNSSKEFDNGFVSQNGGGKSGTGSGEIVANFSEEGRTDQFELERIQSSILSP